MGRPRRTWGCTFKCCSTNSKLDEESDDGWDIVKGKRKYSSSSDEAVLGSTSEKVPPPLQRVGLCALGPGREITPFRPGALLRKSVTAKPKKNTSRWSEGGMGLFGIFAHGITETWVMEKALIGLVACEVERHTAVNIKSGRRRSWSTWA